MDRFMTFDSTLNFLGNLPFFFGAILGLGLSIFVHELGHFLAARKRGLKVTRFSIGMGPRIWSWNRNGVEYRLSLLPIGGYVALPQLADMGRLEGAREDETSPEETEPLPPISFSDKLIVAVMGAVFNFIFAFLLALVLWGTGQPTTNEMLTTEVGYVSEQLSIDGQAVPGPAFEAGIQPGDVITAVDGSKVETFMDIQQMVLTSVGRTGDGQPEVQLEIERDGVSQERIIYPAIAYFNSASRDPIRTIGILPASIVRIHTVSPNSPAQKAGLQPGDVVTHTNGVPIHHLRAFIDLISQKPGQPAEMVIERDGQSQTLLLQPSTVARTKPVLAVSLERSGQTSTFTIRPDFPKNSTERKTDLTSSASLYIHQIRSNSAGNLDRLRSEDRLIAINGKAVESLADAQTALANAAGPVLQLTLGRGSNTQTQAVVFNRLSSNVEGPITQPMVGFSTTRETVITHVNPFKQFGQQIDMTFRILGALMHRGSEIGIGHLSGPIGIVRQLTEITRIDLRLALSFLILMNVNLGILNLLPIPILDGGHILFATLAKIRRKALPARLVASLQGAFMILLLSLMIYVIFKDSVRWHGDAQDVDETTAMSKLYIEPVFVTPETPSESE